nr:zinc finger, CCHC-type [Tanacetum cinerariifolium]
LEHVCDVPSHDNSSPLDVSKDQIEDSSESNEEFSSIDDDSFFIDNIDYVEASPPDSELVGGIDDDILLTIKHDVLHEKSSSTSLNSLLEETNTFDNSLLEFETFCFDVEEISSGSTTTHPDISLPEYEVFYDDHVKEISSGSPTTHSDSSLYASFIFDLSINPFPPADRSDFYESADELIPFISPPEYDCFLFEVEPNLRDFTKDVVEDISPTKEPQVLNTLPTHPTLQLNMKFQPSSESLFTYVVWIFLPFLMYSVAPHYLLSLRNEDIIFDPSICNLNFSRPNISHRCGTVMKLNTHRSHLNKCPMLIHGQNNPPLDVKEYQEKDKIESKLDKNEKQQMPRFNLIVRAFASLGHDLDYDQFVQNYNMHSIGKTLVELHVMLKLHEKGIPKKAETPVVLAMRKGKIQKDRKKPQGTKGKAKGKNKLAYAPKAKIPPPPKRDNPTKDSICHHCKEGLRGSRKLKYGALSLYMGNMMRATVQDIESFDLILPCGLIIVLDNCHFAPTVTRDDFSRYDFVYLMKHKHEVFETFKVFRNEAENQLKKIKAIRSDRGGEYLSHEFVNHMKSCGIGYALKSVALILNIVPTKKVDRMPYEIWHGKAPKLSYLRVWGCEALVKQDTPDKLDSGSIKCIFIRKNSSRTRYIYGYYVVVEEYELGDLDEPLNCKVALADPEFDKWLEAMNTDSLFCYVKEKLKKDKIRSKPDKNGKRGEAGKSRKQLQ